MSNNTELALKPDLWNYDFITQMPSEKIAILVNALRLVSEDEEIKTKELVIPDGCEKYGFVQGYHNLSVFLHFLADMLEE